MVPVPERPSTPAATPAPHLSRLSSLRSEIEASRAELKRIQGTLGISRPTSPEKQGTIDTYFQTQKPLSRPKPDDLKQQPFQPIKKPSQTTPSTSKHSTNQINSNTNQNTNSQTKANQKPTIPITIEPSLPNCQHVIKRHQRYRQTIQI